ncbi:hypothetical protein H0H92_009082 [Tricholoma furcatifolium]|nr:hypothetical protein H0H92_009082 [Tricholoma furcatifolium]
MDPAISVSHLTYSHQPDADPSLVDVSFSLPRGSRTIVVGANGAGKSTLLQILAGKRLVSTEGAHIFVKGRDVFRDSPPGVTFLGTEWAMNPVVRGDILVSAFLDSVGGYRHKERRDRLLDILDVDLDWHMHKISDGERRRVQLCFGLMTPWDVLLLDEVTVDLDVLVRDDLLNFLKADSEARGATILYATHIFDGLNNFPTHVTHMRLGSVIAQPTPWPVFDFADRSTPSITLYNLALQWLKEDRDNRRELEAKGRKLRGARRDQKKPMLPMKPEIIDLTKPECIAVDAGEACDSSRRATPVSNGSDREKKRVRRKKRKRALLDDGSASSVAQTRESSVEKNGKPMKKLSPSSPVHGSDQHQRLNNEDHEQKSTPSAPHSLPQQAETDTKNTFFIDIDPVVVPASVQFASTSTPSSKESGELLLPAHVSVFGVEPAQILPPDAEYSDDDYIDYLDFDDSSKNHLNLLE